MAFQLPQTHKAVRLHPADLTIHVEEIQAPEIEHPDDVVVKVKLAGLCGSDLHGYRGHEKIHEIIVTGHEFVGEVVALGSNFSPSATGRPLLYSTLKVGDFVVSPFSSSCGECHFCRIGFTSRCVHQLLFGSEALPGGQAQYVRVPRAGGVLFVIKSASPSPQHHNELLENLSDPSLLLLADILPTGVFTALQTVQHPNILPIIKGERFPLASVEALSIPGLGETVNLKNRLLDPLWPNMLEEDRILTIAVVGLGPVGICAIIALLDILSGLKVRVRLFAIDLVEARRNNVRVVYDALPPDARGDCELVVCTLEEAEKFIMDASSGAGCNAVLEIVGNTAALALAYSLIRPFGVIISAGVHQAPPLPFTGRQFYNKNVSLVFGRCPVRTVFPFAVDLLRKRQDVFGGGGEDGKAKSIAGVERVMSIQSAPEAYAKFARGEWGKVAFDPWV
ncbi:alcohol dehydrogenase [Fomitiporia mediterranea MF3/22]|uniref:alcohol dehydrogenase n=1 Tax=Fomitiporia mediterranea (strain MF3/22) TaxID=694068 RepID=UPI00044086EB|nr:alcohol dehydrogenase [Fomitiporia mediterranea MF3/22]EJD02537.1 alcohol dehydrogenase [Fomitiporia mediterranea MF3/22]